MDNVQVSDFALQLLESEQRQPSKEVTLNPTPSFVSTDATQQAPDISQVEVPHNFVESIMEGVDILLEGTNPITEPVDIPTPPPVAPPRVVEGEELGELASLIMEVKALLLEVKQVLTEVSTVGAGLGAPAPPKKNKGKDLEDSLERILTKRKSSAKR